MKNKIYLLKYAFGICLSALLVFTGCKKDDVVKENSIELSESFLSFDANGAATSGTEGSATYTVEVTTDGMFGWICAPDEEWIEVIEKGERSAKIGVKTNMGNMPRLSKVRFVSGAAEDYVSVYQVGASGGVPDENGNLPLIHTMHYTDIAPVVISPNGRYMIGAHWTLSAGVRTTYPVLIDLYAGTGRTELKPYTPGSMNVQRPVMAFNDGSYALRDDGPGVTKFFDIEGNPKTIDTGSGYTDISLVDIADDGATWLGIGTNSGGQQKLIKYVDGAFTELKIMEKDLLEHTNFTITPVGISGDGSTVVARINMAYSGQSPLNMGIYWKGSDDPKYIGMDVYYEQIKEDKFGTKYHFNCYAQGSAFSSDAISPNGRYIAGSYLEYLDATQYEDGEGVPSFAYAYIFDTETETSFITYKLSLGFGKDKGIAASNEGIMATATGHIVESTTGNIYDSAVWIKGRYGIETNHNISIEKFCSDNKTIFGNLMDRASSVASTNFVIYYPHE